MWGQPPSAVQAARKYRAAASCPVIPSEDCSLRPAQIPTAVESLPRAKSKGTLRRPRLRSDARGPRSAVRGLPGAPCLASFATRGDSDLSIVIPERVGTAALGCPGGPEVSGRRPLLLACHPERSRTASRASRPAQSRDLGLGSSGDITPPPPSAPPPQKRLAFPPQQV